MKKDETRKIKKLQISRETLLALEQPTLAFVAGGSVVNSACSAPTRNACC